MLSSDFGQVSRAVTSLEKMDYVVTERDKKDKRRVAIVVMMINQEGNKLDTLQAALHF